MGERENQIGGRPDRLEHSATAEIQTGDREKVAGSVAEPQHFPGGAFSGPRGAEAQNAQAAAEAKVIADDELVGNRSCRVQTKLDLNRANVGERAIDGELPDAGAGSDYSSIAHFAAHDAVTFEHAAF